MFRSLFFSRESISPLDFFFSRRGEKANGSIKGTRLFTATAQDMSIPVVQRHVLV